MLPTVSPHAPAGFAGACGGFFHEWSTDFVSGSGGTINLTVPIVLPVSTESKQKLEGCEAVALEYQGSRLAILRNLEFYTNRKEERCARQWGTTCPQHPYIKVIVQVAWLIGVFWLKVAEQWSWSSHITPSFLFAKMLTCCSLGTDGYGRRWLARWRWLGSPGADQMERRARPLPPHPCGAEAEVQRDESRSANLPYISRSENDTRRPP